MPAGGSYIGATESPGSGSRPLYHHSANITARVQNGRTLDVSAGAAFRRAVGSGESLRAQRARGRIREADQRGRMIDRHRPIVAGHIPVKLVVIFEEAGAVANRVIDLDGAGGIDRIGNINLEVTEPIRSRRFVFQFVTIAVGHAGDI